MRARCFREIMLDARPGDAVVVYDKSARARKMMQRLHHECKLAVCPCPTSWEYLDPLKAMRALDQWTGFRITRHSFTPGTHILPKNNRGNPLVVVRTPGRKGLKRTVSWAGATFESTEPFLVEPYVPSNAFVRVYRFGWATFSILHEDYVPGQRPIEVPTPDELRDDVKFISLITGLPALAVDYLKDAQQRDRYYAVDIHVLPRIPHANDSQWAADALADDLVDWVRNLRARP